MFFQLPTAVAATVVAYPLTYLFCLAIILSLLQINASLDFLAIALPLQAHLHIHL